MKTKINYDELGIKRTFYSKCVKRCLDFLISLIAILVLSPVFILTYIFTLIFNGFPAIYKQPRPGKNNKIFYIYKFRSMTNKKDKDGNLLPDSKRITWWGKFIRKTSLDELPQLFNILKGDMSIIGHRPKLVKDFIFYDEDVLKYYIERPGLTGLAQTTGRTHNTWEQVFEKDKAYVQKITFWGDIKIFFGTFVAVFKNTGETHDNHEEDKQQIQEYYYADYLLRTEKINEEQYHYGINLADRLIKEKGTVTFVPELHSTELFDELTKKEN